MNPNSSPLFVSFLVFRRINILVNLKKLTIKNFFTSKAPYPFTIGTMLFYRDYLICIADYKDLALLESI